MPTEKVINYDNTHPVFCLGYMDKQMGMEQCSQEQKSQFAQKIYELSQLSWSVIKSSGRHQKGFEFVPWNQIKRPKPSFLAEDVEKAMVFRCFGMGPMVGHRDRNVFHVIFLSPNHDIY